MSNKPLANERLRCYRCGEEGELYMSYVRHLGTIFVGPSHEPIVSDAKEPPKVQAIICHGCGLLLYNEDVSRENKWLWEEVSVPVAEQHAAAINALAKAAENDPELFKKIKEMLK